MFARSSNSRGTLSWESLALSPCYDAWVTLSVDGPTYLHCGENYITKFRTLVPGNATRGRVSMLRLRGFSRWLIDSEYVNEIAVGATGLNRKVVQEAIWLVETNVVSGTTGADVPNIHSPFDQEKAQLVWQRSNHALRDQSWDNAAGAGDNWQGFFPCNYHEIDVKVKRTWDRSSWSLVYTMDYPEAAYAFGVQMCLMLRGLFRAADAL